MKITGLVWAGTRTERYDEMVRFLGDVMGLESDEEENGLASFKASNGDKFEVFGTDDSEHDFMNTGPVVGFGVPDVDAARSELEEAGVEFLGPTQSEGDYRWAHFRGPDGNIYEITSG